MTEHRIDNDNREPDREDRFMALLALTSQELPASQSGPAPDIDNLDLDRLSPEEIAAVHDYLDAHPEAFERFLARERVARDAQPVKPTRAAPAPRRSLGWFDWLLGGPTPRRYAFALGAAALCAVLIVGYWRADRSALSRAVEHGYAALDRNTVGAARLALPWEERDGTFGFSRPGVTNDPEQLSFGAGLIAGRERLESPGVTVTVAYVSPVYFALGEWNVLAWSGATAGRATSAEFWREQSALQAKLREAVLVRGDGDAVVIAHLDRCAAQLAQLARSSDSARAARDLAAELRLFREQFAPDAPASSRAP
jgi:hypothetical protein